MLKLVFSFVAGVIVGIVIGINFLHTDKEEVVEKVYVDTVRVRDEVRIVRRDTVREVDTVFVMVRDYGGSKRFFVYDTLFDFLEYRLVFDYDIVNDVVSGGLREAYARKVYLDMLFKDRKLYYSVKPGVMAQVLDIRFRYEERNRFYVGGGVSYSGSFGLVGGFGYRIKDSYFLNFDFGYKIVLLSMKFGI